MQPCCGQAKFLIDESLMNISPSLDISPHVLSRKLLGLKEKDLFNSTCLIFIDNNSGINELMTELIPDWLTWRRHPIFFLPHF